MPNYAIQHRRDTTANWLAANPILLDGEIGYERTEDGRLLCKMGDGVRGADGGITGTHWTDLPYSSGPAGSSPEFEWSGTSIRFRNPGGTWGEWIDLKGEQGIQGIQGLQGPTGVSVPATRASLGGAMIGTGLQVTTEGCLSAGAFASCETAADESAKEVAIAGFDLHPGAFLHLLFTQVNTASDLTLAINDGEPKPLLWQGAAPEVGALARGQVYTIIYTGADWQILAGMAPWNICQTVWFEDTLARPGFIPLNGCTVPDFAAKWPQAFAYLNTSHGLERCFESLAEREAAHVAIWHILASGATVGWEGFGGLCKFFYDSESDTLYMPDLRGMFRAMAGDGIVAPGMGQVMGDRARVVYGEFHLGGAYAASVMINSAYGAFSIGGADMYITGSNSGASRKSGVIFDSHREVPTGAANVPRSWGALACAYLGQPSVA